mmetsp:Transcript_23000/g.41156  ORF Transcript_23000/g.41156 Transcript_23000/m.41156 type:complete len:210 (+) Transcript_23000:258-887(+)
MMLRWTGERKETKVSVSLWSFSASTTGFSFPSPPVPAKVRRGSAGQPLSSSWPRSSKRGRPGHFRSGRLPSFVSSGSGGGAPLASLPFGGAPLEGTGGAAVSAAASAALRRRSRRLMDMRGGSICSSPGSEPKCGCRGSASMSRIADSARLARRHTKPSAAPRHTPAMFSRSFPHMAKAISWRAASASTSASSLVSAFGFERPGLSCCS